MKSRTNLVAIGLAVGVLSYILYKLRSHPKSSPKPSSKSSASDNKLAAESNPGDKLAAKCHKSGIETANEIVIDMESILQTNTSPVKEQSELSTTWPPVDNCNKTTSNNLAINDTYSTNPNIQSEAQILLPAGQSSESISNNKRSNSTSSAYNTQLSSSINQNYNSTPVSLTEQDHPLFPQEEILTYTPMDILPEEKSITQTMPTENENVSMQSHSSKLASLEGKAMIIDTKTTSSHHYNDDEDSTSGNTTRSSPAKHWNTKATEFVPLFTNPIDHNTSEGSKKKKKSNKKSATQGKERTLSGPPIHTLADFFSTSDSTTPTTVKCLFGTECHNEKCTYFHPTEICKFYPKCKYANTDECMYIHPKTKSKSPVQLV